MNLKFLQKKIINNSLASSKMGHYRQYIFIFFIAFVIFFLNINVGYSYIRSVDISESEIVKNYFFNGAKIYVKVAYNDSINLIANVVGPKKNFHVTEQILKHGFWIKGPVKTMFSQESLFQVYASDLDYYRKFEPILDQYGLNLSIFLKSKAGGGFRQAFYNHMVKNKYYTSDVKNIINNFDHKIMSFEINLPSGSPEGTYLINLYIVTDETIIKSKTLKFTIRHSEAYSFLKVFSKKHRLIYTVFSILIAIFIGFSAGYFNNIGKNLKRISPNSLK